MNQFVFLFLLCALTLWYWQQKKILKNAQNIAKRACKEQRVTFIDCFKNRSKFYLLFSEKAGVYHEFHFEFLGKNHQKHQGQIIFKGIRFKSIHWPVLNEMT